MENTCIHEGNRCWNCLLGTCHPEPTLHRWWDAEDIKDFRNRNLPPPVGDCGCAFCGTPALKKLADEHK